MVLGLLLSGNAYAKQIILSNCYKSEIAYADGDPVDEETINQLTLILNNYIFVLGVQHGCSKE